MCSSDLQEEPRKRLPSGRPNYVTPAGRAQLEQVVAGLAAQRAALIAKKSAGEPRDLQLRQVEIDLVYYEAQLGRAILVDNRALKADDVRFGAAVSVKQQDGRTREFFIVGEDEADPESGRLNWSSPLAAALLGAKAGQTVGLSLASGDVRLEVLSVRYPG